MKNNAKKLVVILVILSTLFVTCFLTGSICDPEYNFTEAKFGKLTNSNYNKQNHIATVSVSKKASKTFYYSFRIPQEAWTVANTDPIKFTKEGIYHFTADNSNVTTEFRIYKDSGLKKEAVLAARSETCACYRLTLEGMYTTYYYVKVTINNKTNSKQTIKLYLKANQDCTSVSTKTTKYPIYNKTALVSKVWTAHTNGLIDDWSTRNNPGGTNTAPNIYAIDHVIYLNRYDLQILYCMLDDKNASQKGFWKTFISVLKSSNKGSISSSQWKSLKTEFKNSYWSLVAKTINNVTDTIIENVLPPVASALFALCGGSNVSFKNKTQKALDMIGNLYSSANNGLGVSYALVQAKTGAIIYVGTQYLSDSNSNAVIPYRYNKIEKWTADTGSSAHLCAPVLHAGYWATASLSEINKMF